MFVTSDRMAQTKYFLVASTRVFLYPKFGINVTGGDQSNNLETKTQVDMFTESGLTQAMFTLYRIG